MDSSGPITDNNWPICASNADRNRDGTTTSVAWRQSRRAMGKGGIVFYFWEADATEKGSLGPNTVVNSNQINQQRRGFDEKQAWHAHSAARWWVEQRGDHHPRVEYGLSTLEQAFVPSHAWLVRSHRKDFVALRGLVRDFRHDHLVTSSG